MTIHRRNIAVFQHTAARRRLARSAGSKTPEIVVSTHSRPKAAGNMYCIADTWSAVSTHSRPKAAGSI